MRHDKARDAVLMRAFEAAVVEAIQPGSVRETEDTTMADRLLDANNTEGIGAALRLFEELDSLEGQLAALRPLLKRDPWLGLELMAGFSVDDRAWRHLQEDMETVQRQKKGRDFSETAHFALPARKSAFPALTDWSVSHGDGKHSGYSARIEALSYFIFPTTNERGRHLGYLLNRTNQGGLDLPMSGLWASVKENGDEGQPSTVIYNSPQKAHSAARRHFERFVEQKGEASPPPVKAVRSRFPASPIVDALPSSNEFLDAATRAHTRARYRS